MGGRPQSFESQNLRILRDLVPFNDTGADKPPVHDNGAGAALPLPTTYFGPCEPQLLPDNLCQASLRVGHDIVGTGIDPDLLPEVVTHNHRGQTNLSTGVSHCFAKTCRPIWMDAPCQMWLIGSVAIKTYHRFLRWMITSLE